MNVVNELHLLAFDMFVFLNIESGFRYKERGAGVSWEDIKDDILSDTQL